MSRLQGCIKYGHQNGRHRNRHKQAVVVGLHPGTVDSELFKPFQSNLPKHQLLTLEFSAQQMLQVLLGLSAEHTGQCFAWDGQAITP